MNKQIDQRTKKQNQFVSLNRLHLKRDTIQTTNKNITPPKTNISNMYTVYPKIMGWNRWLPLFIWPFWVSIWDFRGVNNTTHLTPSWVSSSARDLAKPLLKASTWGLVQSDMFHEKPQTNPSNPIIIKPTQVKSPHNKFQEKKYQNQNKPSSHHQTYTQVTEKIDE